MIKETLDYMIEEDQERVVTVYKNYLFTLLQNIDLTRGIWMIYLASKGMSLTQLGVLETIFHLTSFTMEVPTGAVADLFGRKISRIIGRAFSLISVVLLLLFVGKLYFYLFPLIHIAYYRLFYIWYLHYH